MRIIGVTGGMGAGKSMVCKLFETLNIPVYYADERAKMLMNNNAKVVDAIKKLLGEEAYNEKGALDRKVVAQKVFNDAQKLDALNAIVHPATIKDSKEWADKQSAHFVLKETALMFETEAFHHVDKVIGVFAPLSLRIQRVMQRNKMTREEVINRMNNQMEDRVKMKLCDWVIHNDEQQAVIPQVMRIYNILK